MKSSNYAISATGLKKSFNKGKVKVLDGIDLHVKRGTVLALLGPNGAGKTTTVRILTTLLQPDEGQATIEGFSVTKEPDNVRRVIGLTGQYAAVDEYLSARENLHMIGRLYHLSKEDSKRRAEELIREFDLVEAADRAAKTYSGGMRRRLDLASSLIAEPPVIFLDEPTTGLDPRSRLAMWNIIKRLVKNGSTILLTTQYLDEADQLADRIAVIDGGKVIAEGTADELKNKVGSERVELVFSSAKDLQKAKKLITGDSVKVDDTKRTLSVANEGGVEYLQEILKQLSDNKIGVEGLSLHKPTLDDVFLELTGRSTEVEEEK
jgi:ABC-2 type transport system ATP-binding protein